MADIEFRHISKCYPDGSEALVDFNLAVADGELMVLVGPSGCGKSTSLRLLAGLDTPSSGELLLGDRRINDLSPRQRKLAMVFQNYALYPHMSVYANLAFPLKMAGLSRAAIKHRVQDVAGVLELGEFLKRKPGQLSGGQRQRVAMGRALVREPHAFLLDEPLSNLDAKLRVQIRSEIAALQRRLHATMIYVTHDQVEAMTLGARVAVLHQGRLQQVGVPQALYDRPANLFVAGFIGSPGMNLFPARVRSGRDGLILQCEGFALPVPEDAATQQLLAPHAGEAVWVGVRPEGLALGSSVAAGPVASISAIEVLGYERLVYLDASWAPEQRLCARVGMQAPLQSGEMVGIEIDCSALHLFHQKGQAIAHWTLPPAGYIP